MSGATFERDLEQFIANAGYEVKFRHASSNSFFYCYVIFDGKVVAEQSFHKPFGSYRRAGRWAKKRVRDHQRMVRSVAGLVRLS